MELHQFKSILLEFLADITNIPEKSKAWFLDRKDAKELYDAPYGYKVLSPYVLVKVTTSTRVSDRPTPVLDENDDIERHLEKEIYYCRVEFKIFTEAHEYHISSTWLDYGADYLGCIARTRKFRVGEDWTRGSDLADGYFCRETWDKIKNDIIRYEMKALSKYIEHGHWTKPKVDECEDLGKATKEE